MTQPVVTLKKAASYMSGPASQEEVSIFKGRVYLEKRNIGILNRQVGGKSPRATHKPRQVERYYVLMKKPKSLCPEAL